jgi:hypothetical protein
VQYSSNVLSSIQTKGLLREIPPRTRFWEHSARRAGSRIGKAVLFGQSLRRVEKIKVAGTGYSSSRKGTALFMSASVDIARTAPKQTGQWVVTNRGTVNVLDVYSPWPNCRLNSLGILDQKEDSHVYNEVAPCDIAVRHWSRIPRSLPLFPSRHSMSAIPELVGAPILYPPLTPSHSIHLRMSGKLASGNVQHFFKTAGKSLKPQY